MERILKNCCCFFHKTLYFKVKIMQTFTKEEVLKHCTRESCWVYIGNIVYVLCCYFHVLDMTWPTTLISTLQVPKWFWTVPRKVRTPEECLQFTLHALSSSGKAWRLVWLLSLLFVWHFLHSNIGIQTLHHSRFLLGVFSFYFYYMSNFGGGFKFNIGGNTGGQGNTTGNTGFSFNFSNQGQNQQPAFGQTQNVGAATQSPISSILQGYKYM